MKNYRSLMLLALCAALALTGCGKKEDELDILEEDVTAGGDSGSSGPAAPATATVKGKVKLEGQAPAKDKILMEADPYCKTHGGAGESDAISVGADGGLQYVFVYVKEGVKGSYPTPKDPMVFDQRGCMYSPHVFGVRAGQPIKILNSDETLHNVHALPAENSQFNLAMPFKGMELTKTFNKPEVMVRFKCDVHPWMSAYAGVMAHPFFAVSAADGSFELPKLPPGNYTLEAWHEKFGAQEQSLTVGDNETKELAFTFKAS